MLNYYEKVNIQEAAITKGNIALETLEKEINDLELANKEEKRQIDLKKKQVPLKRKMEGEITTLQIEVGEIWMYMYITVIYTRYKTAMRTSIKNSSSDSCHTKPLELQTNYLEK